jgi:hypothetical protein
VHAYAGRLTHDENAGRFAGAQYRTRAKRQMALANAAFAYRRQQPFKGGIFRFSHYVPQRRDAYLGLSLFVLILVARD